METNEVGYGSPEAIDAWRQALAEAIRGGDERRVGRARKMLRRHQVAAQVSARRGAA